MKARVSTLDRLSSNEKEKLFKEMAEVIHEQQSELQTRCLRLFALSLLQENFPNDMVDRIIARYDYNCERFAHFKKDGAADWAIESDLNFLGYQLPMPKEEW